MNRLVNKIKEATSNLAAESGDIGSESNQNILSKKLSEDIDLF